MTVNHPIDDVLIDNVKVDKSAVRSYVKERTRTVFSTNADVREADLTGVRSIDIGGLAYNRDTADTTSADNDDTIITSGDGGVFKRTDTGGHSYPLALWVNGKPTASEKVLRHDFTLNVNMPANFAGSKATCEVAPTANAVFSIRKNNAEFATLVFSPSPSGVGVFSVSDETPFVVGDSIAIVAPASVDSTLANISITLLGTR